jgi:hypothetical protein
MWEVLTTWRESVETVAQLMVPTLLLQLIQTHVPGLNQPLSVIGNRSNINNALHQVALTNAKSIDGFLTRHTSFIRIARWHAL